MRVQFTYPSSFGCCVNYQEASVVRCIIVYNKSGTFTLFAFDAGEGLSEHTAPFDTISTILNGEAEITIELFWLVKKHIFPDSLDTHIRKRKQLDQVFGFRECL